MTQMVGGLKHICTICSHRLSNDTVITTVVTEHDCDMTTDNVACMVFTNWFVVMALLSPVTALHVVSNHSVH